MLKIKSSNKIAIIDGDKKISYTNLIKNIDSFNNIIPFTNNKIAIIAENSIEWTSAFLSIWDTDNIAIPINWDSNEEMLRETILHSKPKLIFVSKLTKKRVEKAVKDSRITTTIVNLENVKWIYSKSKVKNFSQNMDKVSTIVYTSGTSGTPSGVMLSKNNFFFNIKGMREYDLVRESDVCISFLPFYHSYGLCAVFLGHIFTNATIILSKEKTPKKFFKLAKKHSATSGSVVPIFLTATSTKLSKNIFNKMYKILDKISSIKFLSFFRSPISTKMQKETANLRYICTGGSALPKDIDIFFKRYGVNIAKGYGLTESAPIISCFTKNVPVGSCGKILKGIEIKINKEGEILAKGPNIMQGYYQNPSLTNEIVIDGWLQTGDIGYVDKNSFLFITGRKKDLIVLPNGKNIWPQPIENIFNKMDLIEESCVFNLNGKIAIAIRAYTINREIKREIESSVQKYNSNRPFHERISKIIFNKDKFPRTSIGKIQRYKIGSEK